MLCLPLSRAASARPGRRAPFAPLLLLTMFTASAARAGDVVYSHGDAVLVPAPRTAPATTRSMLGGPEGRIESTAIGAAPANGQGWTFNNLGGFTRIRWDAARGKVLFTPQDSQNYNAVRRYDSGAVIGPQRHVYKAHYVRNVMLLDGQPYAKSYQWKHERLSWVDSVSDTNVELKVHNWLNSQGPITFINRTSGSNDTWWGGHAGDSNGGWALLEVFMFTGNDGINDGRVVTRVHKNGRTQVSQNRAGIVVHADATRRFRYFVEQNYFGNFGQIEDGPDNPLPKPQVRQLWSDDSLVQVGNDDASGWQRLELRDNPDLRLATVREVQNWNRWDSQIGLRLNTGGLPPGEHDLYLVVVDGLDAEGWDVVSAAYPLRVRVAPDTIFVAGLE